MSSSRTAATAADPHATPQAGAAGQTRRAALWRMVMPKHLCPFGVKSLRLLRRRGYAVEDHHIRTPKQNEAFKAEHHVRTTPQTFIEGRRIGGYDALRRHFGLAVHDPEATTYAPVIATFGAAAALAAATAWGFAGTLATPLLAMWFGAFAMCLLAVLKLQNLEGFTNGFLGYDLLARHVVPYAYAYPFLELGAGVLMLAGFWPLLAAPVMLLIGGIGAVSVFKAVWIDRRELKCACVGGGRNVPLGFVSLAENLVMVGLGLWMLLRALG